MARPRINMIGRKNGKLTVVREIPSDNKDGRKLFCLCECGKTRTVMPSNFHRAKDCLKCDPTTANIRNAIGKSSIPKTGTVTGSAVVKKRKAKVKEDQGLIEARTFSRSCSRGGWE